MLLNTDDKYRIIFQIDDEYEYPVSRYPWYFIGKYIGTNLAVYQDYPGGSFRYKYRTLYLHIFLFGATPDGLEWDHKDRNPLNNQKENLHLVTSSMNCVNRTSWAPSGHLGIQKQGNRWRVFLTPTMAKAPKAMWIGDFNSIDEAKSAQDLALKSIQ